MQVVVFAGVDGALVAVAEHEFDRADGVAVAGFDVIVEVLFIALGGVAGEGAQDEAGVRAQGEVVAQAQGELALRAALAAVVFMGAFDEGFDHVNPRVVERDARHEGEAAALPGVAGAVFQFVFDAELGLAGFGVVGRGDARRQQQGEAGGLGPVLPPVLQTRHGIPFRGAGAARFRSKAAPRAAAAYAGIVKGTGARLSGRALWAGRGSVQGDGSAAVLVIVVRLVIRAGGPEAGDPGVAQGAAAFLNGLLCGERGLVDETHRFAGGKQLFVGRGDGVEVGGDQGALFGRHGLEAMIERDVFFDHLVG